MKKNRNIRKQSLMQVISMTAILVFLNIISSRLYTRFDLTSEKRYSLSQSSKLLASELKEMVYFKIYLDGDLPPGFKQLKNSTRDLLEEFRVYAGDRIEYQFIDPSADADDKERMKIYKQLTEKGLQPTQLEQHEKGSRSQSLIFPGALVTFGSTETPLQLLKSKIGGSPEEMLNNSIEGLEYEIATTLRKLTTPVTKRIAFLQGQNELSTRQITDAANSINEFYRVDTVNIHGQLNALDEYHVLIIAKPQSAFEEKDKFIIDQFIMRGGRVLWLIDKMQINMDSLSSVSTNIAMAMELNLDDLLFQYGVRVNNDLILDLQAAPIPVVTGYVGDQPKQELFPWYYFPLLNPESKNPIVNNLNAIKAEFISSIDTIENKDVRKTILLTTSKFCRIQMPPARVSLNILQEEPDPSQFRKKDLPVAVMLEGTFTSNYKNRIPKAIIESREIDFKERSQAGKMIVISDGDIIANYVSKKGTIYPLGFDRFTQQYYGNKNFILNCIDYLCDENGILELRGKEIKLRMLDPVKTVTPVLLSWTNVLAPVVLVLLYGMFRNFRRKHRFGK
jgi:ABC-2 type transport system permease protein